MAGPEELEQFVAVDDGGSSRWGGPCCALFRRGGRDGKPRTLRPWAETGSAGVALVTGAGGGIGRAIARGIGTRRITPLALVERDADALAAVVTERRDRAQAFPSSVCRRT